MGNIVFNKIVYVNSTVVPAVGVLIKLDDCLFPLHSTFFPSQIYWSEIERMDQAHFLHIYLSIGYFVHVCTFVHFISLLSQKYAIAFNRLQKSYISLRGFSFFFLLLLLSNKTKRRCFSVQLFVDIEYCQVEKVNNNWIANRYVCICCIEYRRN